MVIKRTISLDSEVFKAGESKANRLFSKNFSAYIGYLISKDNEPQEPAAQKKVDRMLTKSIDDILNI